MVGPLTLCVICDSRARELMRAKAVPPRYGANDAEGGPTIRRVGKAHTAAEAAAQRLSAKVIGTDHRYLV